MADKWDELASAVAGHTAHKDAEATIIAAVALVAHFGRTLERVAMALEHISTQPHG